MSTFSDKQSMPRSFGRRQEDWFVRDRIKRQSQLLHVGQIIVSEINMSALFEIIMEQTNQILDAERSSVFLYCDKDNELRSLAATGMHDEQIRVSVEHGIAGWVFQHREPLLINDCYNDPRFYAEIDKKTGFHTRNILCFPLINRSHECIGALQALNKKTGDFTNEDVELLVPVSNYIAIALENSKLYEELKLLDKAKERVINHLSHELRTPLAIVSGVLDRVLKKVREANIVSLERAIAIGYRNVTRLQELQVKIDDLLHQKPSEEKQKILNIIQDALYFVEELNGQENLSGTNILDLITERIESLYRIEEVREELIVIDVFLNDLCNETAVLMKEREIEIVRNFEKSIAVNMDRNILKKVCGGILKNAVEKTPDEGMVDISAYSVDNSVQIDFRDFGIGISPENQKMIFGGFFHTQDTDVYSSREPYMFNAGGSGSDLLRIKALSEQYGFRLDFNSSRCVFIPADRDICMGRISRCRAVKSKQECFASGGSIFSVIIPKA
ncbi:MAG: GAF domain-containing protein [Proteobacteria bacterium]|nr:GAF domain-containing protein [Pseudomonadota bacterium]